MTTKTIEKVETGKEEEKNQLPIIYHEREIMESLENNLVTIVCGETGSGKSTQIPQFILQNHMANAWKYRTANESVVIGITQPRRFAEVSLA